MHQDFFLNLKPLTNLLNHEKRIGNHFRFYFSSIYGLCLLDTYWSKFISITGRRKSNGLGMDKKQYESNSHGLQNFCCHCPFYRYNIGYACSR